jgi:hypothetical protein
MKRTSNLNDSSFILLLGRFSLIFWREVIRLGSRTRSSLTRVYFRRIQPARGTSACRSVDINAWHLAPVIGRIVVDSIAVMNWTETLDDPGMLIDGSAWTHLNRRLGSAEIIVHHGMLVRGLTSTSAETDSLSIKCKSIWNSLLNVFATNFLC